MTWADLFERGRRYDVTVESIREARRRVREGDDE